jgi:hypothetical protein
MFAQKLVTLNNTLTYNVNLFYKGKMINALILLECFVFKNTCIENLFYVQNLLHVMEIDV